MPETLFHFNPNTVKESSLEFKRVASCDDDTYLLSKVLACFLEVQHICFNMFTFKYVPQTID